MAADLTPKQAAFVAEYLIDLNASAAAVRAGYSPKSAHAQSSQLLANPKVATAVRQAFGARVERLELSQDAVVKALMAIAFTDLRSVARWDEEGNVYVTPSSEIDDVAAYALKEITVSRRTIPQGKGEPIETTEMAVKMYDRQKALELLGKHLGMFSDKLNVNVTGGITLSALARMVEPGQGEIEG